MIFGLLLISLFLTQKFMLLKECKYSEYERDWKTISELLRVGSIFISYYLSNEIISAVINAGYEGGDISEKCGLIKLFLQCLLPS